jgi:hypothetical protein
LTVYRLRQGTEINSEARRLLVKKHLSHRHFTYSVLKDTFAAIVDYHTKQ